MKIALLDVRKGSGRDPSKSSTVAYRNMSVLADELKADLFVNPSDIPNCTNYEIIICGFGSTSCEKERQTEFLLKNDKAKIFWLIGEYEQSTFAPLFYSKREFEVIKNFEHKIKNKKCIGQHFVNINTLLYDGQRKIQHKKYDCIYYGRWRPDRIDYFKQYLDSNLYLSTHPKNIKMFHHNGCNPKLISTLSWLPHRETLSLFRGSLYIEDLFTHSNYNCLANRYYEAIMCNVFPFFDKSCLATIRKSGLKNYEWFIVEKSADVAKKIKETEHKEHDAYQILKNWQTDAGKEKKETINKLKSILGV